MSRMVKNNLYDEMCHVLTDFECCMASGYDCYDMLVKIQNNWEELTGDDDD